MKKYFIGVGSLLALPLISLAQVTTLNSNSGANEVVAYLQSLFSVAITVLIGLAGVYFIWGVIGFITKAGEEKDQAKDQMLWGVIIIAVMLSFWGLVKIVVNSVFSGDQATAPTELPTIPGA